MAKKSNRSYPADTKIIDELTGEIILNFLNSSNIHAELYSYYQTKAEKYYNQTTSQYEVRLYKKDIDSAKKIGEIVGISQPTFRKYRDNLYKSDYMEDKGDYFLLPYKEHFFFEMPLETIQFLLDVVKKPVIKTLIYLGHQYQWKCSQGFSNGYEFTLEELAEHIGEKLDNNSRNYTRLNNYLEALQHFGFIKITNFYDGKTPKKRIYYLNLDKSKLNDTPLNEKKK